jgi:hypothetical protein
LPAPQTPRKMFRLSAIGHEIGDQPCHRVPEDGTRGLDLRYEMGVKST